MKYRLKPAMLSSAAVVISFSVMVPTMVYAEARIGVAAGIENDVTGLIGTSPKPIKVGDGVFQDQVVRTAVKSTAQLLFMDETALTVGPRSQIVLDKFVYDPTKKSGDIVLNATKGAFRFVSGSAKSTSYKIRTPVATIGVRGTIFDWFITAAGDLLLMLVEGGVVANTNSGQTITLDTPGQFVIIRADGSVEGPSTWVGQLLDVAQGIPFPLFGRRFENDQTETPTVVNQSDLNDAIDNTDLEPPPSPPPPPPPITILSVTD